MNSFLVVLLQIFFIKRGEVVKLFEIHGIGYQFYVLCGLFIFKLDTALVGYVRTNVNSAEINVIFFFNHYERKKREEKKKPRINVIPKKYGQNIRVYVGFLKI